MHYYSNLLYFSEFRVLVHRFPEDGRVPPKHRGVNKKLYCYVYHMWNCWFYKPANQLL